MNIRALAPVMVSFFIMGFVDLVGIAANYVKDDFSLTDSQANLFTSMVFFWFLIFSVPHRPDDEPYRQTPHRSHQHHHHHVGSAYRPGHRVSAAFQRRSLRADDHFLLPARHRQHSDAGFA
jgi:hypothetical protein